MSAEAIQVPTVYLTTKIKQGETENVLSFLLKITRPRTILTGKAPGRVLPALRYKTEAGIGTNAQPAHMLLSCSYLCLRPPLSVQGVRKLFNGNLTVFFPLRHHQKTPLNNTLCKRPTCGLNSQDRFRDYCSFAE